MGKKLKYPMKTFLTFPVVFGGVLLIFGSGFFYRKTLVMINSEDMREKLRRPIDKEAEAELNAFKKEHNKQ